MFLERTRRIFRKRQPRIEVALPGGYPDYWLRAAQPKRLGHQWGILGIPADDRALPWNRIEGPWNTWSSHQLASVVHRHLQGDHSHDAAFRKTCPVCAGDSP